jgi:pyruvate ferredoxin oxidoreductase beta subunit
MTEEWKFTTKDIAEKPELFLSGHRACAGCAPATVMRLIMKATRGSTIVTQATGCMEVASSIYPYTSWATPWLHTAFENAAANASGIEAALKVMKKKGRLKQERVDVIAIAGDGGTYDIGIQALSGAVERGHDFLFGLHEHGYPEKRGHTSWRSYNHVACGYGGARKDGGQEAYRGDYVGA